jgi:molybdopterin/thiamine biosynthesis adenylyltransferase
MAEKPMMSVSLRIPEHLMDQLHQHLFPGDGDEHGAVIAASVFRTSRGIRLLAHKVFLAEDGTGYVPGRVGYRALTSTFVMDAALECADLGMAYLAVHCHGGSTTVGFSETDMGSHECGYPAVLDILNGPPAGGLVFAQSAVAGDIWFPDGSRSELDFLVVPGRPIRTLRQAPEPRPAGVDERYDRQTRLFGDRGQKILSDLKVGVIGAGGAGSLVIEQLARLGVGEVIAIDPDRIEASNLPRVVGSKRQDVRPVLTHPALGTIGVRLQRFRTSKVKIAQRLVHEANRRVGFVGRQDNVVETQSAELLLDCDYVFLAADSMQARLVFNALVHQYLIPGCQMGVKAQVDSESGEILDLFCISRPVIPGTGCLWCNGLISPSKLQDEATSPGQLRRQRYVPDDGVHAPSVITLNAIAASLATNDFLMSVTGLLDTSALLWTRHDPRNGEFYEEVPRSDPACRECSDHGRLGKGALNRLPTKS